MDLVRMIEDNPAVEQGQIVHGVCMCVCVCVMAVRAEVSK